MTDILPEPTDPKLPPVKQGLKTTGFKFRQPDPRKTIWLLGSIIALAALALIATYSYTVLSGNSQDNIRKQDLNYTAAALKSYHALYKDYPTFEQLNSPTFGVFMPSLDRKKFEDPPSDNPIFVAKPETKHYAYEAYPAGCNDASSICTGYKLVAELNNGNYILTSPKD